MATSYCSTRWTEQERMRGGILLTPGDPKVKNHTYYYWTPDRWWHEEFFKGSNLNMVCVSTFALKFLSKNIFCRDSTNTMSICLRPGYQTHKHGGSVWWWRPSSLTAWLLRMSNLPYSTYINLQCLSVQEWLQSSSQLCFNSEITCRWPRSPRQSPFECLPAHRAVLWGLKSGAGIWSTGSSKGLLGSLASGISLCYWLGTASSQYDSTSEGFADCSSAYAVQMGGLASVDLLFCYDNWTYLNLSITLLLGL